jgi:hypothetical protein
MRADRLERLRARFERLRADGPRRSLLGRRPAPSLEALETLDGRLTRAGVHTAADLRLLLRLARRQGGHAELAILFGKQADGAVAALEARLDWNRRTPDGRWAAGELCAAGACVPPGGAGGPDRRSPGLTRGGEPGVAAAPPPAPAPKRWARPRTAVASLLLERGLAEVADPERRRLDVQRAHALLESGALEEDATELRLRAARDRAWDAAVPAVHGWAGQAGWALDRARRDPGAAYAALRVQYLRAVEAGAPRRRLALRRALDSFRLALPRRPGMRYLAARRRRRGARTGWSTCSWDRGRRPPPLLDLGRAAARSGRLGRRPLAEERVAPADTKAIAPDRRLELAVTGSVADVATSSWRIRAGWFHDLASGSQRVRRLVGGTAPRPARRIRARVYLADASGSMRGAGQAPGRTAPRRAGCAPAPGAGRRAGGIRSTCASSATGRCASSASRPRRRPGPGSGRLVDGGPSSGMTELSAALRRGAVAAPGPRDPSLARPCWWW